MTYPMIDPIAFKLGPIEVYWYGIAYIVGILGWWGWTRITARRMGMLSDKLVEDFITWAVIGVILGGRLGYVMFYKPSQYMANPIEIFQVWKGGMSFHGGLLGVLIATWFYCKRNKLYFFDFTDVAVCGVPIGLFLGRIANFINGELFGRITDSPLGMVFPSGGPLPRHPSQLYEAFLEGLVLFVILWMASRYENWSKYRGRLSGLFLAGYGLSRIVAECFREPDAFLGFIWQGLTMGQILSLPILIWGVWLMYRKQERTPYAE